MRDGLIIIVAMGLLVLWWVIAIYLVVDHGWLAGSAVMAIGTIAVTLLLAAWMGPDD
jgi:hypothetical protein